MTRHLIRGVALVVLLTVASGCGTAIREGLGVAEGGKGVYAVIRPVSPDPQAKTLGEYTCIQLGRFDEDFGNRAPQALFTMLPGKFREKLAGAKLPNHPGGKKLLVTGTVLHYEAAGMSGVVLGDVEQVLARVRLVDESTGEVLGVANCVGRTKTRLVMGVGTKAEGLAESIVAWIRSRYPEPQED